MKDSDIRELVRAGFDLHVHVGPDILPRKYTARKLMEEEKGKIRGLGLKAHSFPTISAINATKAEIETDLVMVGSITLNYFMGGFNPSAVYASAVLSPGLPVIVSFPTIHAENHLKKNYSAYEIPPEWVKDPKFVPRKKHELKAIRVTDWNGRIFGKCMRVLDMVKRMNCIVATGHLSWEEARELALVALDMGLKVIVTHPYQKDIDMPVEVQKELTEKGAYVEYCYIMYLDRDHKWDYPPDEIADLIRAVGPEHCILTSDTGQLSNPAPSDCTFQFVKLLQKEGIAKEEFEKMIIENPIALLGLDG